jgi:hypothetical protein
MIGIGTDQSEPNRLVEPVGSDPDPMKSTGWFTGNDRQVGWCQSHL